MQVSATGITRRRGFCCMVPSEPQKGAHLSFQAGEIWVEGERRGGFGFVFDHVEHVQAQRGVDIPCNFAWVGCLLVCRPNGARNDFWRLDFYK